MRAWAIVVHGGAGVIERKDLSPEQETAYRAAMNRAIQAGGAVLSKGGSALDAIEATIQLMEDDPLFNAGRGAVFTAEGRNELDAAIMDGKTLSAGSVAGVTRTRHAISLARRVMEKSPHVMLISQGADSFRKSRGWNRSSRAGSTPSGAGARSKRFSKRRTCRFRRSRQARMTATRRRTLRMTKARREPSASPLST